jgi:hypothetical protein
MNNSLPRLIDGMIASLRQEIIPHIDSEFARGQAFGVIFILSCIRRRSSWSNEFLLEQIRALEEASRELGEVAVDLAGAPRPAIVAPAEFATSAELERIRDEGDARVCDLIDWLAQRRDGLPSTVVAKADATIRTYMRRQLQWEMKTSAKPMFDEISRGSE